MMPASSDGAKAWCEQEAVSCLSLVASVSPVHVHTWSMQSAVLMGRLTSSRGKLSLEQHPTSQCWQAWRSSVTRHRSEPASNMQSSVSRALAAVGIAHRSQASTDKGLFVVNILTTRPRVVIQVDGPSEFTVNTSRPLGEGVMQSHCHACPQVRPMVLVRHQAAHRYARLWLQV